MRSFRKDSENLRDTRIAYTFLLSLALVCAILGIVATQLGGDLQRSEMQSTYEVLTLCADALEAWSVADGAGERYAASVRFENAAASLPSEVELEPILSLADYMRMGESAKERVRAFADTFALLSSIDYTSESEARRIIAETLGGVSDKVLGDTAANSAAAVEVPPPEVLAYTKRVAEGTVKTLFGGNAVGLELIEGEGGSWITETENLRMSFSGADGSLEGFVYIRVGDAPGNNISEADRLSVALEFYKSTRRGVGGASVGNGGEVCGFTLCEITDGEERWHITVDAHGRVWSLTKVKR